ALFTLDGRTAVGTARSRRSRFASAAALTHSPHRRPRRRWPRPRRSRKSNACRSPADMCSCVPYPNRPPANLPASLSLEFWPSKLGRPLPWRRRFEALTILLAAHGPNREIPVNYVIWKIAFLFCFIAWTSVATASDVSLLASFPGDKGPGPKEAPDTTGAVG